jgi:hypothetical protein
MIAWPWSPLCSLQTKANTMQIEFLPKYASRTSYLYLHMFLNAAVQALEAASPAATTVFRLLNRKFRFAEATTRRKMTLWPRGLGGA